MLTSSHFLDTQGDTLEYKFNFEEYVINNLGLDVYGENKKNTLGGVCILFLKGGCNRGIQCPYKHIRAEKAVVCKHWLRGLCKKEDQCEFLHEYNLKKMPECWFYSKYKECASGEECIYLHIDPEAKIPECPWYNRGFCKHGPDCKNKHIRRLPCYLFLAGFCPKGPDCELGHPKFEIPVIEKERNNGRDDNPGGQGRRMNQDSERPGMNTYNNYSRQNPNYHPGNPNNMNRNNNNNMIQPMRRLEDITCYKCNEKGHYANHCTT